jgi:hypothetical protein
MYLNNWYSQLYRIPLNRYNNRLLPLSRQFFRIRNIVNEFMDLRRKYFTSRLNKLYIYKGSTFQDKS